jgi:hypothetical protein
MLRDAEGTLDSWNGGGRTQGRLKERRRDGHVHDTKTLASMYISDICALLRTKD